MIEVPDGPEPWATRSLRAVRAHFRPILLGLRYSRPRPLSIDGAAYRRRTRRRR